MTYDETKHEKEWRDNAQEDFNGWKRSFKQNMEWFVYRIFLPLALVAFAVYRMVS